MRLPIVQQPAHLLERDRLRHEEIDAAREGFGLVSAGGETSECDDERGAGFPAVRAVMGACVFDVADGAGGFEAVHYRHGDI